MSTQKNDFDIGSGFAGGRSLVVELKICRAEVQLCLDRAS